MRSPSCSKFPRTLSPAVTATAFKRSAPALGQKRPKVKVMNTWNQIETQLRSWTPRPPSQHIREKLFGEGSQARSTSQAAVAAPGLRSEEHTSELQSQSNLVCRLLLEKKKK